MDAFRRFASVAFSPQYETAVRNGSLRAALAQVAFERVRITLRREDGTLALDTVVFFPSGTDSLALSLNVSLPADAPASGVPLSLNLAYVNAAGDTVFRGGPVTVTAIPSTGGGTAPPPVQVPVHYSGTGADATAIVISPRSVNGTAGQAASFSAQALASNGQVIAGTPVIFTSSDEGIVHVDPITGSGNLTGRGTARVYAQLLNGPRDSATVSVVLPAARIALVSGGAQVAPAGTALAQPVVARVLAADGIGAAGVTVSFAVTSGGGSVTPASAVSAADGSVSASWKLGSDVGAQALSLSATGLAGSPLAVVATALATTPTRLAVVAQPANGVAGSPLAPVTVAAQTADGVTAATFAGDVTVALGANPGGATLGGTTTVSAVNGIATFTGLSLNRPAAGYTLVFSSATLSNATSSPFGIVAGSAARLVISAMPSAVDVGIAIAPPIQVTAQDSAGNTVTSFTGAVTMAIGNNPGASILSGTLARTAVAGIATFNDLSLNKPGASYTLVASAPGLAGSTSAAFNAAAGAPTGISVVSGGGQTAAAGTTLSPIVLKLRDALGNGVSGMTIALAVATGGGSLGAASAVTDVDGLVTVSWTLGGTSGAQSITASATGVPNTTITATATGGTASKLAIATAPSTTQTAGVALTPGIAVQAQNSTNVLQAAFTGAVTATVASGPSGATIGGTATVAAVGGVATFSALRLTKAGAYTLQFASSGLTPATTASFTVNAAPAQSIAADSGSAQSGTAGAALAQKLVVLVTDSLGNPVGGKSVSWAVASGGGSVDSATTVTNSTGRTRVTFTLGGTAGSNTATATSAGLTGSPVTFTATVAGGAIASTLVSPHLDTLTSISATFALTAQAKDGAGGPLTGHFTWLSRNSSVAVVDTNGVVKAITNGSAYVVATETGGTRDSALIVVQQRLATISVTPGTRSIYLGASYPFTASAVDGLGSPMTVQPSFTWSTASGAIATANATTGVATGTGLGSTLMRATAGTVTGTATISVLTPIIRIVVSRDSAGFSTTTNDAFTLAALGRKRSYRATARDTLDNPITGITFAWTSSNGAVASLDSINTATVRATAAANGTTNVTATAQGVSGAAALSVQQVLTGIHLTPTTASVAPTGATSITAHGLDANGFFIPGGTFSFASSLPSVATVVAATGVVTGIAPGTALVTATSGAVNSDTATITVGTAVPATISFGRDTLTIGRSATSVSIPVYLSKPSASNVKILLAVSDTSAYFSQSSITIPAGSTSGNALLNGHNAATTHLTATDSAAVYSAGAAVLAVQASVQFATSYYYLNVTDQVATQILLSDPAPAGGTYVTYSFGTPSIGTVSPSPAFIPAGQLAANVVVQATGAGNTTITPSASGASGIATTLYASAAALGNSATAMWLGAGQYEPYQYVYLPTAARSALAVSLTSSDTSKVTVPSGIVIPLNGSYAYYTTSAKAPGSATVTSSATGWTSANTVVTVTTPKVSLCCGNTYPTTQPALSVNVYAEDSMGTSHYRTSGLVATLSSSDTSILKVLSPTVTIPAGQTYTYLGSVIAGGAVGTAKLYVSASGHTGDSTSYTFFGPPLSLSWSGSPLIGAGQQDNYRYVSVPNSVLAPLIVTLTSSDSTKVAVPHTVTIPTGSSYVYFVVTGKAAGTATITATAAGFSVASAGYTTTTPRLALTSGYTLNNFAPATGFTVYIADSTRYSHTATTPLVVTYTSTDTTILKVTGSDTVQAGVPYATHGLATPVGVGSAKVVATAAGVTPDTTTWTVQTPTLSLSWSTLLLGRRQYDANRYVSIPNSRPVPVVVTLAQKHANVDSVTSTTLTIPANSNYLYFSVAALANGADTITATATGYNAVAANVVVSTPKFTTGGLPGSATTTTPPSGVYVYATDSVGNSHTVLDSVLVKATSSNTSVIQPTAAGFRFAVGGSYALAQVAYVGPGSATVTYSDSLGSGYQPVTTNSATVTGPSLSMYVYSSVLGMRQNGGSNSAYVSIPNAIATPLTVNLVSTDPTVVTVPATVVIPAGSTAAYYQITAHDVVGTIQVQATATGYSGVNSSVQVTQPKFMVYAPSSMNTTSPAQTITIYAADANGTTHYTNENVAVTLTSSSSATATIDSIAPVTILANTSYHNTAHLIPVSQGTTVVNADDARGTGYAYVHSQSTAVAVNIPTLYVGNSSLTLGIGQYSDAYVYTPDVQPAGRTVNLAHFNAASSTPGSLSVAVGSNNAVYRVTGASTGIDTITFSATAHNPVKGAVTVAPGHGFPSSWPATLSLAGTDSVLVTLYAYDASNNWHYVASATTFNLAGNSHVGFSNGTSPITSVVIPANAYYVQFWVKGLTQGTDSSIQIAASGYTTQSVSVTVNP